MSQPHSQSLTITHTHTLSLTLAHCALRRNNENLQRLSCKVVSPLMFAHVRAAYPGMPVSEQNWCVCVCVCVLSVYGCVCERERVVLGCLHVYGGCLVCVCVLCVCLCVCACVHACAVV